MRPYPAKDVGKGKGPARRRPRRDSNESSASVQNAVQEEDHTQEDNVSEISSVDSVSSWELEWEINPNTTIPATQEPAGEVPNYTLPAELAPTAVVANDPNSEDEDDHTGTWRTGDLESLVMALNHYRAQLRGKFFGCAGGKARRDNAWRSVAAYVNERCSVHWTVAQCKGKSRRFSTTVKEKFNALKRELYKTGGGEIDDDAYLTRLEESMLDYIGIEGVVGLPGMHGSRLKAGHGREHRRKKNMASNLAWDPVRKDKRSYLTLDRNKIKLAAKKRAAKK